MNQQERLTEYLEKHGKIDPLKAWTQLGIYRLADTVFNLRKKGYEITTTNKKVKNRFKEVCIVAEYKLEGSDNEWHYFTGNAWMVRAA